MAVDDPLHGGKANAGAAILVWSVKPAEGLKNTEGILFLEANPIVSNEVAGLGIRFLRPDFDPGLS